jgi:hypothetical protein
VLGSSPFKGEDRRGMGDLYFTKEPLNKSQIVIPAKAGIHSNQKQWILSFREDDGYSEVP